MNNRIFFLLFAIPFLAGMGIDLYAPSMPAITYYFHTKANITQLTVSLYFCAYAIAQFFLGFLSDNFGRKKILLISGFLYTCSSLAAVYSPNILGLIAIRMLQGAGIAGLCTVIRASAADCLSGPTLAKAMTYFCTSWALGPILGPVIGGYLQHYFHWQANFYFFTAYGVIIFTYLIFFMPETHQNPLPLKIDKTVVLIGKILSHPEFITCAIIMSLLYSIVVIFNMIGPFLIQVSLHYSVVDYAHMALLLGLSYFVGTLVNQRLLKICSPKKITWIGLVSALIASLLMLAFGLTIGTNIYGVLAPNILILLLAGFTIPNILTQSLSFFPENTGATSAMLGSLQTASVFIVTTCATALGHASQVPMAITYSGMLLTAIILLLAVRIRNRGVHVS